MPTRKPDRYKYAVVAHVMVDGASDADRSSTKACWAQPNYVSRIAKPDGTIIHAEIARSATAL